MKFKRKIRRQWKIPQEPNPQLDRLYNEVFNKIDNIDKHVDDLISKINSNRTVKENIKIFLENIEPKELPEPKIE